MPKWRSGRGSSAAEDVTKAWVRPLCWVSLIIKICIVLVRESHNSIHTSTVLGLKKDSSKLIKHLKKSNAACFYAPIVLKLLIVVQMWKQHEEGN